MRRSSAGEGAGNWSNRSFRICLESFHLFKDGCTRLGIGTSSGLFEAFGGVSELRKADRTGSTFHSVGKFGE